MRLQIPSCHRRGSHAASLETPNDAMQDAAIEDEDDEMVSELVSAKHLARVELRSRETADMGSATSCARLRNSIAYL